MIGSSVSKRFQKATKPSPKKRGLSPVSVRLTEEEHEQLRDMAGTMSMAAFIRLKVFGEGDSTPSRKAYTKKRTAPSAELVMVGAMLGGLGESEVAANLSELAEAARDGSLPVSPDTEHKIIEACRAVSEMRAALISAMGIKPHPSFAEASED